MQNYGIMADVVPADFTAEGVLSALYGKLKAGDKVLLPRAAVARNVLPEELSKQGIDVTVVPAYKTETGDADKYLVTKMLSDGELDMVTFTSSSTVKNIVKMLGDQAVDLLKNAKIAAIGPITAETCRQQGLQVDVQAEEYTIAGLIKAIKEAF